MSNDVRGVYSTIQTQTLSLMLEQVLPNAAMSYFAYELFKGMMAGAAE